MKLFKHLVVVSALGFCLLGSMLTAEARGKTVYGPSKELKFGLHIYQWNIPKGRGVAIIESFSRDKIIEVNKANAEKIKSGELNVR